VFIVIFPVLEANAVLFFSAANTLKRALKMIVKCDTASVSNYLPNFLRSLTITERRTHIINSATQMMTMIMMMNNVVLSSVNIKNVRTYMACV